MSILTDIQRTLPIMLFIIFVIFSPEDTKIKCKQHIVLISCTLLSIVIFYILVCYNVNEYISIVISLKALITIIIIKNRIET